MGIAEAVYENAADVWHLPDNGGCGAFSDWGFIKPTQAEILSVVLVITGLWLVLVYRDKGQTGHRDPLPADPMKQ